MIYSYDFRCTFNDEIIKKYNNKENIDEWGYALVTINGKYGAEYNLCIEDGKNYSAIYFQECDEKGIWQTDFTNSKHYEVDFSNPNWKQKLQREMKHYVIKELNEDEDLYLL